MGETHFMDTLPPLIDALETAVTQRDEGEARRIIVTLMSKIPSERKDAARRQNAKLGGRPKGATVTPETRQRMIEGQKRRWQERKKDEAKGAD